MSKHTEGPWTVRKIGGDCFVEGSAIVGHVAGRPYRREIMCDEAYPEKEADAALISAAPDLLECLRQIISDLPTRRDWLDPTLERAANNAIAKAQMDDVRDTATKRAVKEYGR